METTVLQFDAEIALNEEVSPTLKVLALRWPDTLEEPKPGQFFTFLPEAFEPGDAGLLRRPLAFAASLRPYVFSLYQARGTATRALARKTVGSRLNIVAPLGDCFPQAVEGERTFIVGGGIGIGPVLFLAGQDFARGAASPNFPETILGFRTSAETPNFSGAKFARLGEDLKRGIDSISRCLSKAKIATDDGSSGLQGTAVDVLKNSIDENRGGMAPPKKIRPHIYGCGPKPMLKALAEYARDTQIPAHLSAEQWMACGVGACYGCVLPTPDGSYLRVCKDGPVFEAGQIVWGQ